MERQELGQKLKELREKKGLSKYRVYTDANIRPDQVNAIEAGSVNYTIDTLAAYLKVLGVVINLVE